MFDHFTILSGNVSFAHRREQEYPDDPPIGLDMRDIPIRPSSR
jgi:hypothetical protein